MIDRWLIMIDREVVLLAPTNLRVYRKEKNISFKIVKKTPAVFPSNIF